MRCRDALHCSLSWGWLARCCQCAGTPAGDYRGRGYNTTQAGMVLGPADKRWGRNVVKTVHLVKCFLLYNIMLLCQIVQCPLHAGVKPPVCAGQSIRTRSAHGEGTFVREGCMNAQLRWRIVDSRMCGPRHLSIRLESGPAPGSTHRNGRTPRHPTHHYSSRQCFLLPVQFSIF